jgi:hypothetical protein
VEDGALDYDVVVGKLAEVSTPPAHARAHTLMRTRFAPPRTRTCICLVCTHTLRLVCTIKHRRQPANIQSIHVNSRCPAEVPAALATRY